MRSQTSRRSSGVCATATVSRDAAHRTTWPAALGPANVDSAKMNLAWTLRRATGLQEKGQAVPYMQLSDEWLDRPAVASLSRSARLLAIEMLSYSARVLADGVVPAAIIRRISDAPDADGDLGELQTSGLITAGPGGSWLLTDWLDSQGAARDEVVARRRMSQARSRRRRKHLDGDHSECNPGYCSRVVTRDDTAGSRDTSRVTHVANPTPSTRLTPTHFDPQGEVRSEGEGRGDASLRRAPAPPPRGVARHRPADDGPEVDEPRTYLVDDDATVEDTTDPAAQSW